MRKLLLLLLLLSHQSAFSDPTISSHQIKLEDEEKVGLKILFLLAQKVAPFMPT